MLERVTRIELAFSAWEADVLPLNYTRLVPSKLTKGLLSRGSAPAGRELDRRRGPGVTSA
jgi:hypothetical protein